MGTRGLKHTFFFAICQSAITLSEKIALYGNFSVMTAVYLVTMTPYALKRS
jgi:hypothetical protein